MSKRRNRKRSGGIAREDYRTGGRVGYQEGGRFEYDQISGLKNQQAYDPVAIAQAQQDAAEAAAKKAEEEAAAKAAEEAAKAAEEAKKAELRQSIDDAAAGKVPTQAVIPDADAAIGQRAELLVDRLALSIIQGYTTGWHEVGHNHELGSSVYNTERNIIVGATEDIVETAINDLNATYGGSAEITVFPGIVSVETTQQAYLYNVSTISTSGHAFEYVGAGVTYNALPFFGGTAIPEQEIIETSNGKVFAGGTVDQIGNFRVGNFFGVNALTGSITLNANEIDLKGLTSVGPFIRDGIPVGVELKEVSDNANLVSSIGTQDFNTAPTQKAVSTYVENRYLNKLTGGTVEGDITLNGDFDVNGDVISTDTSGAFNLLNTSATTINAFCDATSIGGG